MLFDREMYVGVDPAAGQIPFVWAALDQKKEVASIRHGSLEELLAYVRGLPQVTVAVNSPRGAGQRLLARSEYRAMIAPSLRPGRFSQFRVCEYQLKIRNIRVIPMPVDPARAPGWMKNAIRFYEEVARYDQIRLMEVSAHAAYCALLGRIPFNKNTIEGRIQRQLALTIQEVHLRDPMDFFEEITRRRLLQGVLPAGILQPVRELDALAAAFTAWQRVNQPEQSLAVGDEQEGQIILPVPELKDHYSAGNS